MQEETKSGIEDEPFAGAAPAVEDDDLGPLFSGAVAPLVGGGGSGTELVPFASIPPEPEESSNVFPSRAALDRYLRLTGAKIMPRTPKAQRKSGEDPAWIETLSNGRLLVCELGLRWHLAETLIEARGVAEKLRLQEVNTDSITRQWMDERADLFRANPSQGILDFRALLDRMDLSYREQAVIGWRMADFLVEGRVVVEVDDTMRRARKARMDGRCRDQDLVRVGFLVLRLDEKDLSAPVEIERRMGALMDDVSLMGKELPSMEIPSPGAVEHSVIRIYTDGGCSPNPGKGGYGVILSCEGRQKELSGGYRLTSNNRMEVLAAIVGLEALRKPGSVVTVISDSRYLVDAINKGWAQKWKRNGWMRTPEEKTKNADLWARLLNICAKHKVSFEWVRGHVGHLENERCDQLAGAALEQKDLPPDLGYVPTT